MKAARKMASGAKDDRSAARQIEVIRQTPDMTETREKVIETRMVFLKLSSNCLAVTTGLP